MMKKQLILLLVSLVWISLSCCTQKKTNIERLSYSERKLIDTKKENAALINELSQTVQEAINTHFNEDSTDSWNVHELSLGIYMLKKMKYELLYLLPQLEHAGVDEIYVKKVSGSILLIYEAQQRLEKRLNYLKKEGDNTLEV